jgi:DNA-directed RNA polymerase subunit M/transcription elongation factor TFIIS
MNVTDKIWKFSNTGMKMHCFDNGKALCNSNIRRFASDAGIDYSEAQVNYNLCARCETKFETAVEATETEQVTETRIQAPAVEVIEITEVQDEVVIKLPATCCECYSSKVVYTNYLGYKFCARCADGSQTGPKEAEQSDDMRDVAARIRDRKAHLIAYESAAKRLIEPTLPAPDFDMDPMTGLPIVTVGPGRYVVGLIQGKAGVPYSPRFVRFWLVDGHRYYEAFEDSSRESIAGQVWAAQAALRDIEVAPPVSVADDVVHVSVLGGTFRVGPVVPETIPFVVFRRVYEDGTTGMAHRAYKNEMPYLLAGQVWTAQAALRNA